MPLPRVAGLGRLTVGDWDGGTALNAETGAPAMRQACVYIDMCVDMHVDICIDMHIDMHIGVHRRGI